MDRTKEFNSIVELTEIPQYPFEKTMFYPHIKKIEQEIDQSFTSLSKITSYESFKSQTIITKLIELLNEYKNSYISQDAGSRDFQEVLNNLKSMINTKYLKYMLRLNEIKRKYQKEASLEHANPSYKNENTREDPTLMIEEQETQQRNEFLEERKRIVRSISEIGQIVEDISIHVRLQEEQLKRIDDIVLESNKWSKKALNELDNVWFMVKSNRKVIIKFFAFWFLVIIFFWLLRRF